MFVGIFVVIAASIALATVSASRGLAAKRRGQAGRIGAILAWTASFVGLALIRDATSTRSWGRPLSRYQMNQLLPADARNRDAANIEDHA